MCGIVGFLDQDGTRDILSAMLKMQGHRGPDSTGLYIQESLGLYLGHNRLAIQDLTEAGNQPMESSSARYVIAFNGEIYNHLDLRESLELEGQVSWRGTSDTETLLMAIERWGFQSALERADGMFALALWDTKLTQLTLARDRFGEKPVYYGWQRGNFMFASELKALTHHPKFECEIDRRSLALFFELNYVPTPGSIYKGIKKLEPATYAVFSASGDLIEKRSYWQHRELLNNDRPKNLNSDRDVQDRLNDLIVSSISKQMVSDVPLGAFLSGGIDSALVVSIMQSLNSEPIKTFTIGMTDKEFDESSDAATLASYLGTDHTELLVTPEDLIAVVQKIPEVYDEPFGDMSAIPTMLVAKLARGSVTVCLSGDGGDELFGGYNRYFYAQKLWKKIALIPFGIRSFFGKLILRLKPSTLDQISIFFGINKFLPHLGNKVQKAAYALKAHNIEELYLNLVSIWQQNLLIEKNGYSSVEMLKNFGDVSSLSEIEKMMFWDKNTYLMDDILVKTDRACMSHSLEGRVPFLSREIAEFSAVLPEEFKIRGGVNKWVLRELLGRYIPRDLIDRPKRGFGLPMAEWLRGPLKDWAESVLCFNKIERNSLIDKEVLKEKWDEHQAGRRDWSTQIWSVLMFQLWLNYQ